MIDKAHNWIRERRAGVFAAALLGVLFLYVLEPGNLYLAESLRFGVGECFFVVLGAFFLYFRGFRDGGAVACAGLFVLWLACTRVLNGDVVLREEGYRVAEAMLIVCFTGLGAVLDRKGRRRVLTVTAAVCSAAYVALSLVSLYSFITRTPLYYPVTQSEITVEYSFRLSILGYNPNVTALWFLLCSGLLLYLFFRCRSRLGRLGLLLCLLVEHTAIAACYSRNVELAWAGCLGLLVCLLAGGKLRGGKALRIGLLVLLFAAAALLGFKSFTLSTRLMERAYRGRQAAVVETAPAVGPQTLALRIEEEPVQRFDDDRPLSDDADRLALYGTFREVVRREPLRLLRGCGFEERMAITNELMYPLEKGAFHNSWLEILNYTGLPGLALLLGYTIIIVLACFRLLLSRKELALRCLALPVLACFSYSLFESLLFFRTDARTLLFYLLAGIVAAESAKKSEKA